MLKILYTYIPFFDNFYLFQYISFRSLLAAIIAMGFTFICGKSFITFFKKMNFGESIYELSPKTHAKKSGTPTMGGILILTSLSLACIICGDWTNLYFVLLLCCTILFGLIGFADDYRKITHSVGMSARLKMVLTLLVASIFCICYIYFTPYELGEKIQYTITSFFIPFIKGPLFALPLVVAFLFWIFVIISSTHAVNLTDGLDGLAIGTVAIISITLCILAYLTGTSLAANYLNFPFLPEATETSVFLAALAGACIGFLWFNAPPASLFMGDTGALALGGALGMSAVMLKKEVWFFIASIVLVAEALSVILQVVSYKLYKKRIFKMAPLHHHFELSGWPESRVVIRFWLITLIFNLLALSTLRIQ